MKRHGFAFHAKEWMEFVVVRAEKYAASAVVISADFTSRPGRLGTPKVYLLVGSNEFHQGLPDGFDLDEVLNLLLSAEGVLSPYTGTNGIDISFRAKIGQRDLQSVFRSTINGIELVLHLPAFR